MLGGSLSGPYQWHTEFRGAQVIPVPAGRTATWTTEIDLPKGLWFVQVTTYFQLKNVNFQLQLHADGVIYGNGSGAHNSTASTELEVVTIPSIVDDVRVTSAGRQTIKVFMYAGAGGGAYGTTGIAVVAHKKRSVAAKKKSSRAAKKRTGAQRGIR